MWKPEHQRIHDLRVTMSAIHDLARSAPPNRRTTLAIENAASRALSRDKANEMPRDGKTHAIKKLTYALINPKGEPISLHTDLDQVVGYYAATRRPADIILDEASRQRIFAALIRNRYTIRKCYAWVRIGTEAITKLPPGKEKR